MQIEDFQTKTWKRLSKVVQERIDALRKLNDADHPIDKTAQIRGGIRELTKILDLAEQVSSSEAVNPGDFSGVDQSDD